MAQNQTTSTLIRRERHTPTWQRPLVLVGMCVLALVLGVVAVAWRLGGPQAVTPMAVDLAPMDLAPMDTASAKTAGAETAGAKDKVGQ